MSTAPFVETHAMWVTRLRLVGLLIFHTGCLSPITSVSPLEPEVTGRVEFVATGARSACALLEGGSVHCWGAPGLVGDGTRSLRVEPVSVTSLASGVSSISSGLLHSCALSTTGHVKCWGENASGALGDPAVLSALEPIEVQGLDSAASEISAGASHTCARLATGEVRCWGENSAYQLGAGAPPQSFVPAPVLGLPQGIRNITAGATHTCAITASGDVLCWGGNLHGELGTGTASTSAVATPSRVVGLPAPMMMVTAGRFHTCALSSQGSVWCWGQNEFGALGDDTSIDRATPVEPVGLPGPVVALSAGAGGTCAVLNSGDAYCWGSNGNGQLGDGTRIHRARPVLVVGLEGNARMLSYGESFSCAATRSLRAMCWGTNDEGQLGDGTVEPREMPGEVSGL